MNKKVYFNNKIWLFGLMAIAYISCTSDNDTLPISDNNGVKDKYFIAATHDGATYFLTADDLEKDSTITTRSAIEKNSSFSHYGYNQKEAVMAINYQQGNPAPASIFQLNANGELKETGDFILPVGFSTIGAFDKYLVASRSGRSLSGANQGKTGAIFYLINLETYNVEEKVIVTENFIGNRTAEFAGAVDAGNGEFFVGVKLIAPEEEEMTSPDSVYVAKLDSELNIKAIYKDNRLSYSTGEFRSARYSHIANDDLGDTYVFSGSHNANTTKNAGALVIRKGELDFDSNYYFDIENTSGGYRFKRVYHITEDYFLLEMYNEVGASGGQNPATQFAVIKMSNKEFTWIRDGFPAIDNIENTGWPFAANGKAYIGVTTSDAQPAVYIIKTSGIAKKGVTIDGVTSVPGLAKLSTQNNL